MQYHIFILNIFYTCIYFDLLLLLGMLSKSMGQILRVSAAMHLLFHIDKDDSLPSTITETAIKCAIDFVEVCCQHTAYLTGRGNIEQELKLIELGKYCLCEIVPPVILVHC